MGTTIPAVPVAAETGAAPGRQEPRSGRRKWVEGARRAPIPLPGEPRAAVRPDRRLPGGPLRGGRDHPARWPARDGHGGAPAAEGPRRLRHQRRAPARQAGRAAPARLRGPRGRTAGAGRRHRRRRGGRSGLPQHQRRRGSAGPGRRRRRRGRRGVRRLRGGPEAEGEHRVRLGQPDRPGHPGQRPVGGGRRHPRAAARGDRLRRHPGVLLQRPRRPDRPVQPVAAGRGPPRADAGGRLSRAVHHRDRRAGRGRPSRGARVARRRGAGGVPGGRRRADVRGDQADAARLPGAVRRVVPRERPLRVRRHRPRARAAARARQHLRRRGRGLAAHREVRRRQGPRHRQVGRPRRLHLRRRGVLPRQAGARLRPLHHPARRRPPRLRRPDDGAVRRVR